MEERKQFMAIALGRYHRNPDAGVPRKVNYKPAIAGEIPKGVPPEVLVRMQRLLHDRAALAQLNARNLRLAELVRKRQEAATARIERDQIAGDVHRVVDPFRAIDLRERMQALTAIIDDSREHAERTLRTHVRE